MREVAGTQSVTAYIRRRQETAAHWVALKLLLKVCIGEKRYKGGGRRREAWWRQDDTDKKLWTTLARVSQEYKRRRQQGERVTK